MKTNFSTLKITLSVIGLSLCILTTSLSFISDSKTTHLNMDTASAHKMSDENHPEKG